MNISRQIVFYFLLGLLTISCCESDFYTKTENGFYIQHDSLYYLLEAYNNHVIRSYTSPVHPDSANQSMIVDAVPTNDVSVTVKKRGGHIALSINELNAVLDLENGSITYYDLSGNIVLQEAQKSKVLMRYTGKDDNGYNIGQSFKLKDNEAIYGFGQHQDGIMSHRGQKVEMYQHNMKVAVPVMVSSNGYGVLWDNYSYTTFEDNTYATWNSELGDGIDYYFIYGPNLDSVVTGMRFLTGEVPMLPKWAFGLFQSKARYETQEELLNVVKYYRENNLPLDVIVQDWQYWPGIWGAKEFDRSRYPDPVQMVNDLHDKYNTRIMISVWPCLEEGSLDYREMDSAGFLYENNDRRYYDAYNKAARDLYWKQAERELFASGIDAWWCDATEPEINGWETDVEDYKNMMTPAIGSATRYLNLYSYMHSKGMYENQRKVTSDKRVFNLTRSAFTGQQKFATVTWSGDVSASWDAFEKQISAGLNFCITGLPYWTTDIGAFFVNGHDWFRTGQFPLGVKDPDYHEFFVRWYQYGAFSPIFRVHGAQTPREIWNFGEPGDWAYDIQVNYSNLRYRLLPYIYSLSSEVSMENYTLMRHMVMDFQSDSNTFNIGDQYMFGPSFLVKPVTEPRVNSVEIYLPDHESGWFDFWNGTKYNGNQHIQTKADIQTLPLFVKAGSIVPMGPFLQYSDEKPTDTVELRIYTGADANFTLYEDEHTNYNYEDGKYCQIALNWNEKDKTLTIGDAEGGLGELMSELTFHVALVNENHGVGVGYTQDYDKIISYKGKKTDITF